MHTNTTTNYGLPQFVGTDKPSWLGDVNGAMADIDTAIKAREVEAGTAQASADTANGKADALATRMTTAESNITALQNAETGDATQIATNTANIAQNAQDIVQLDAKIGHTQITIGDHTVTGAIATLAGQGGIEADNVAYNNTQSGLTADDVQEAIDELASRPTVADASDVSYDNTTSGMTADDVQEAIDELHSEIASAPSANVRWNSVTDRFEVLKNGSWVQSIRAFVNSLAVFVAGVFNIGVSNGVYKATAGNTQANAFQKPNDVLTAPVNIMALNIPVTLVTDDLIDFTNYASVKITENGVVRTFDVSGYTGSAYLCYRASLDSNNHIVGAAMLSTTKENFESNVADNMKQANKDFGTTSLVISEITIE